MDLLGNKFWQVRMVCFYVNLHKFCTKSRLFLFAPFSRSSIFASEISFLALNALLTQYFGPASYESIFLFFFLNQFLNKLISSRLHYILCLTDTYSDPRADPDSSFIPVWEQMRNRLMKNYPLEFYFFVVSGANSGLCWPSNLLHIEMIKFGAPNISDAFPNKAGIGAAICAAGKVKKLGSFVETSGPTSVMSVPVSPTDSCFPFSPSRFLNQILDKYFYDMDKYIV